MGVLSNNFPDYVWIGGFPQLGVPFWVVLIIRIYNILGSILGSPYVGKLPLFGESRTEAPVQDLQRRTGKLTDIEMQRTALLERSDLASPGELLLHEP